jgi:phosphatidylserine/phosphatidylglycerophosphate/cardiolipin synthase-like enzyme
MSRTPFRLAVLSIAVSTLSAGAAAQTLTTFPGTGFAPVYDFMNSATKTLDMTMYELVDTTAEQDLAALAKKGVVVRVILDQNSEKSSNTAAYTYLSANGVSCHWANPSYAVTHQKTITVDGATSLILTANLVSEDYATTRDFAITDTDAKDVAEIEAVFNDDFANGAVTPTAGDSLIWSPNLAETDLLKFIKSAQHTLLVENEEMSNSSIVTALASRAKAAVAVTVIMTNDKNTYSTEFQTLTKAGVKVYTYPFNNTALYIHAKVMSLDYGYPDANAYLGSINFSTASMTKNRELGQTTQDSAALESIYTTLVSDAKGGTLWPQTKSTTSRK